MRYWILSCVNQVNHVERLIPAAFKKCQAAGSIAFCADEGSTDKTRTRRRFVRKSSPHCSSTNRRLANPSCSGIYMPKVMRQSHARHFGERAGHLDADRPGAHEYKC